MFFLPNDDENGAITPRLKFFQWSNVENYLFSLNGLLKVFEGLVDFVCFVLFGFGDVIGYKDEWNAKLIECIERF